MFKFKHALFHSYLPFFNFLGQIIHFCKSNWVDLIEINLRFLQTLSSIVTYVHTLEKTWPKQVHWKLSSKPKISHLTINLKVIVIVVKFDPSSFTYAIFLFSILIDQTIQ
jgi:hypothetical protein